LHHGSWRCIDDDLGVYPTELLCDRRELYHRVWRWRCWSIERDFPITLRPTALRGTGLKCRFRSLALVPCQSKAR
jgi:hypothetical protein